ncbi:MAG: NUDIX domain-containing protein, partial [Pseudoruegeria sp.]
MIAPKDGFSQAIATLVDQRDEATYAKNVCVDDAKFVVVLADGSIATTSNQTILLPKNVVSTLGLDLNSGVYLGQSTEGPIFAIQSKQSVANRTASISSSKRSDVLGGDEFSDIDREAVTRGCSLLNWNKSQSFCGHCGTPTKSTLGGFRRDCPNCNAIYFPRIDPTVIMLPIHDQKCLLGRNAKFSTGWYTALSGFVEPGETLESAIFREVQEEAGVTISSVR